MSNAIHGKDAVIYISPGTGAAVPIGEQMSWSIDYDQPLVNVSPLANSWNNFVKGMSGWTMSFGGNFDKSNKTLWTASIGSTKSNVYVYPIGASAPTQYYYGTGWVTLGKIAEGSTTTKASNGWKVTGDDPLYINP
jgi:hypothetical protein